jgi:hypothetical protein
MAVAYLDPSDPADRSATLCQTCAVARSLQVERDQMSELEAAMQMGHDRPRQNLQAQIDELERATARVEEAVARVEDRAAAVQEREDLPEIAACSMCGEVYDLPPGNGDDGICGECSPSETFSDEPTYLCCHCGAPLDCGFCSTCGDFREAISPQYQEEFFRQKSFKLLGPWEDLGNRVARRTPQGIVMAIAEKTEFSGGFHARIRTVFTDEKFQDKGPWPIFIQKLDEQLRRNGWTLINCPLAELKEPGVSRSDHIRDRKVE